LNVKGKFVIAFFFAIIYLGAKNNPFFPLSQVNVALTLQSLSVSLLKGIS